MSSVEISRYYRRYSSPLLPFLGSDFIEKDLISVIKILPINYPPKFSQIVGCKHKTILEGRNLFEREIAIVSLYQGLAIERQVRAQRTIIESRYYTRTHAYVMIHPAVFYPTARARFLTPTRCVWYSKVNTSNKQMPVILLIRVARGRLSRRRIRAGNYPLRQFVSLERRLARTWPFHFSSTAAPVLFSTCAQRETPRSVTRGARFLVGNA